MGGTASRRGLGADDIGTAHAYLHKEERGALDALGIHKRRPSPSRAAAVAAARLPTSRLRIKASAAERMARTGQSCLWAAPYPRSVPYPQGAPSSQRETPTQGRYTRQEKHTYPHDNRRTSFTSVSCVVLSLRGIQPGLVACRGAHQARLLPPRSRG